MHLEKGTGIASFCFISEAESFWNIAQSTALVVTEGVRIENLALCCNYSVLWSRVQMYEGLQSTDGNPEALARKRALDHVRPSFIATSYPTGMRE